MRPKSLALLLLALGCGLVASIGITRVMQRDADSAVPVGAAQGIYIAATDVGMGDLLTPDKLQLTDWPKDKMPEGAISKQSEIDGRRARARLYKGEPILENRLFPKGTSAQGAAMLITKGLRVVPVKVDSVSGCSSLILPGDQVDVMGHFVRDPNRGIKETVTQTILQNVKVFAVDNVLDVEKDKQGSKSINAKTISLLVTPKQASLVLMASQSGTLNLIMRGPYGEDQSEFVATRPDELFRLAGSNKRVDEPPPEAKPVVKPVVLPPVEKPKPRPMWSIKVLGPGSVNTVTFEKEPAENSDVEWKQVTSDDSSETQEPPKESKAPQQAPPPKAPATVPQPPDADEPGQGDLGPLVAPWNTKE